MVDAEDVAASARRHVRERDGEVLASVARAADAVAAAWPGAAAGDAAAVADPLRAELRARGVHGRLPALLAGAVGATGRTLRADPVAAPPYVVVTSRGPVLRATLADGRLVLTLGVFAVEREPGVRYVRDPADDVAVAAEFVPSRDHR